MADTDPITLTKALYGQLVARRPTIDASASYYDGQHNLAFASEKFLEAFGGLFRAFADNWCGVVVDAVEERLNVEGFRTADDDEKPYTPAWDIWQRNKLDAQSQLAHQESLIGGVSYAVVWLDDDSKAQVMVESAASTIVADKPSVYGKRAAALRCWMDDAGYEHAQLFLPDELYLLRSKNRRVNGYPSQGGAWIVDPDGQNIDTSGRMPNPLGVVPVVPFLNKPRLYLSSRLRRPWAAHSEIVSIVPLQDAVNKLVADLLVASEFAAYAQRYVTGYEPQVDPETGQEMPPPFKSGAGKVWVVDDPAASFGQFAPADLSNFVQAVDMVIQHVASISRTPPHYLNASADRLSGESIKAAETGLVAKVRRKMRYFGESWEEVMRLCGMVEKDSKLAEADEMETVWADPESRTEAEHVDAALKKASLEVPLRQLWEDLGYSPSQIDRFDAMRQAEALLQPQAIEKVAVAPFPSGVKPPTAPPSAPPVVTGNAGPPA